MLKAWGSNFSSIRHDIGVVIADDASAFVETLVHFNWPDGRHYEIYAGSYLRRRADRIAELRVFMDASPMFTQGSAHG